jgi:hypothetical protein
MPYYNNIPKPLDRIYLSQDEILQNFQIIPQLITENHINFGAAAQGKHKFVSIPIRDTAPTTNGTEVALYSKLGQFSGQPELWIKRKSNPPTIGATYSFTETSNNSGRYWFRWPSGIMVKFGTFTVPEMFLADQQILVTYFIPGLEQNIPEFTSVFNIKITPVLPTNLNNTFGAWVYPVHPFSATEFSVRATKSELTVFPYRTAAFEIFVMITGV